MIETVVESIRVSLVTQHRVVILKEVNGERHLPIWIGSYEAEAIAMELQGVTASRPLPYDLIRTIIDDMGGWDSPLGHHPDRVLIPGVEIGTGSLGHGLGIAVGAALGLRAQGHLDTRTFVLLGDAELDEGSNHEAIAYAAAIRLPLTAIVIDNQSATHGWPGGIAARFIGWSVSTVNGRDHDAIERALADRHRDRPHVVIASVERKY